MELFGIKIEKPMSRMRVPILPSLPDRRCVLRNALLGTSALAVAGCASASGPDSPATGSIEGRSPAPSKSQLSTSRPSADAAKVAMLLPLTGAPQVAAVARALQQSAELAVIERNAIGIQLLVKDDKGTEAGARVAAEEAIKAGAELIVGPLFSKAARAVTPIARSAGVPVLALSNDPSVAGSGVYLFGAAQSTETSRVIAYAAGRGRQRFAALLPDDAEGRIFETAFQAAVARSGGHAALIERYTIEDNGVIELERAKRDAVKSAAAGSAGFDVLFMPAGEDTLPQLASVIGHIGLDLAGVRLLGSSGWDYPNVSRQARLMGSWFAAPELKGWYEFAERFAKTQRAMPPRLATLSYDAIVVAETLASGPRGSLFSEPRLTRTEGFTGADGAFRLMPSGHVERDLAIIELRKTGATVVDAAAPSRPFI